MKKNIAKSKDLEFKISKFKLHPEHSLLTLSLPIIIGMVAQVFYNITDMAFVGRLGVDAIAALTFSFPLYFISMAINGLLASGTTPLIAQRLGAKNKDSAGRYATDLILFSTIFSLLFLGTIPLLGYLFSLMGATASVIVLGVRYLQPIFIATPFIYLGLAFSTIMNSEGDTKTPAIIQIISVLLNVLLDYIFIFHLHMGVLGASMATVTSLLFGTVVLSILFLKGNSHLRIFHRWRFSRRRIIKIFKIGTPATMARLLMAFSWLIFNAIFASFGTATVAAYGLIGKMDSVAFMPLFGLSVGLLTLVGMFYGAERYDLVKRIIKVGVKYGLLYTIPLATLIWIIPNLLLRILTTDKEVILIGVPLLRIDVFVYPFIAIAFLLGRSLLGMGDGKPSLVITSVRLILVAVPLALLLTKLGYGPGGVMISIVISGVVASVIALLWVRNKLAEKELV